MENITLKMHKLLLANYVVMDNIKDRMANQLVRRALPDKIVLLLYENMQTIVLLLD